MAGKNAVERRLDIIEDEWFAFTAAEARVGRWRLDNDGIKLVETFLESQTRPDTAVPDFFMRLLVPFTDPLQHGVHLRTAFLAELDAAADDIRDAGHDPVWPVPALDPSQDDIGQLLACMHAFHTSYRSLFERVIVVQLPGAISDPRAWNWWLERMLQRPAPPTLRMMVFDRAEAPLLDELAGRYPQQLMTLAPELDTPAMPQELVREYGGNTPADQYRRLLVGMTAAGGRGNVAGALTLANSAIRVAERQGWTQQVAVVHMATATMLLGAGRWRDALAAFGAAEAKAQTSQKAGDPGSDKVVVQAQLARAGALLSAGELSNAAAEYERAIGTLEAQPEPDALLLLEARRMAAYCHEQTGRPEAAWQHLGMATKVAERIDPGMRPGTTLPYAGQALLRLTELPSYARYRPLVEQRLAELLGPEWPSLVAVKVPA